MKKIKTFSLSSAVIAVILLGAYIITPNEPKNFIEAKQILKKAWEFSGFNTEFYCQAPFEITQNAIMLTNSNAYLPRNAKTKKGAQNKRAQIIEFEHIMPAHNFGQHLECWRQGGRKACRNDKKFNEMEADLYNLVPAIGEINADRGNFRYAMPPHNLAYNQYGECKVYTDFKAHRFYPAEYSRGLIARTYLYMSEKYDINLSEVERKLMQSWDKMYPPNDYEKARDNAIKYAKIYYAILKIKGMF